MGKGGVGEGWCCAIQSLGRFSKDNVTSRTTARARVITERD